MNVKVSIGESIDKLSILELKIKKITNEEKQLEIRKEINELQECCKYKQEYDFYYKLLMYVNEVIWNMTDIVKGMPIENPEFATLSNNIFEYNQKRFRIKNWFNLSTSSLIKEQKSYATTHCKIIIENETDLYIKIPEINYLLLEYDTVSFETTPEIGNSIKNIFRNPTIIDNFIVEPSTSISVVVNISNYTIPLLADQYRNIFAFNIITYIIGGLLGDFIQSLSVVCENFYNTGRKGIILISNKGDKFRNGLENTYKYTYGVIMNQKYVEDYKIYNGEHYDIDLTMWRNIRNLTSNNWHYNYSRLYNVNWGKHKWIEVENDSKWSNKVLINTTNYRWSYLDLKPLYEKYKDDLLYISADINQYKFFCEKTKLPVEYCNITDFFELCTAISSCKLFVGNLSSPLYIAHSVGANRICALCGGLDDKLNINLDKIWDNIYYSI